MNRRPDGARHAQPRDEHRAAGRAGQVAGAALLLVVGAAMAFLVVSGDVRNYVQPAGAPVVGVSAVLVLVLGAWTLLACRRRGPAPAGHSPRAAAWLLLVPAVLAVAAPAPLGSALLTSSAVGGGVVGGRAAGESAVVVDGRTGRTLDPAAPAARGATTPTAGAQHRLNLADLSDYWAAGRADELQGRRVTLVGFAAPDGSGGWLLGRFAITCCAADALPVQAALRPGSSGTGLRTLAADRWYEVTGTVRSGGDVPVVVVEDLREVPQPEDPYL